MNNETISKVKDKVEEKISKLVENDLKDEDVVQMYKLIDIHKDIANEEYWKKEEDKMRYSTYGRRYSNNTYGRDTYGRDSYGSSVAGNYNNYSGRMRDSQGRFMGEEELMKKSEEILEALNKHYGNYSASSDAYSNGNYGAKDDSMESLNYMLESVVDFMAMLKKEAKTRDELDLIKRYAKTISEM